MERTQGERTPAFLEGLDDPEFVRRFLARSGPARLDHPHRRARPRGMGVLGDLLERRGLGDRRPRHRGAPEQHARRAGPQPARLPPPSARPAAAEHDGADDRCCATGSPSWRSGAPGPTGSARRSCRRSSAWSTTGLRPGTRCARRACTSRTDVVYAEPGIDTGRARGARAARSPGSGSSTCSSAARRRSSAIGRGASGAAVIRVAGVRRWSSLEQPGGCMLNLVAYADQNHH